MIEQIERNFKCLADINRLRIVKLLGYKNMCVCELSNILKISQPAVSKHLKKLRNAGMISAKQNGFWTDYFLEKNAFIYLILDKKAFQGMLDSDEIIKQDLRKAKEVDRTKLCSEK